MNKPRNIAILLHEKDPYPDVKVHFIWGLCELWRQAGHWVEIIKGARTPIQADLLIPHVDLTVLPAEYAARLEQCSRVVNRRVRDISKRLISRQLVTGDDDTAGPVIVKTNLNFGGAPEAQLLGTPIQKNPRLTDGAGADVVFEASGTADGARLATQMAGVQGRIMMVGIQGRETPFDLFQVFYRELSVLGARAYSSADFREALRLLSSSEIDPARFISHRFPLAEIQAALEFVSSGASTMKTLIHVG